MADKQNSKNDISPRPRRRLERMPHWTEKTQHGQKRRMESIQTLSLSLQNRCPLPHRAHQLLQQRRRKSTLPSHHHNNPASSICNWLPENTSSNREKKKPSRRGNGKIGKGKRQSKRRFQEKKPSSLLPRLLHRPSRKRRRERGMEKWMRDEVDVQWYLCMQYDDMLDEI